MLLRTKLIAAAAAAGTITVAGISCLTFDQGTVTNINSEIGKIESYESNFSKASGKIEGLIGKIQTLNGKIKTLDAGDNTTNSGNIIKTMNNALPGGKLSEDTNSQDIAKQAENVAKNEVGEIVNPYKAAWAYEYDEVNQANMAVSNIKSNLDKANEQLSAENTALGEAIGDANQILEPTKQK